MVNNNVLWAKNNIHLFSWGKVRHPNNEQRTEKHDGLGRNINNGMNHGRGPSNGNSRHGHIFR